MAVAALTFVANAQAVLPYDGGKGTRSAGPVATTGGGFDWGMAALGIGVGLGAILLTLALVLVARNRRRPQPLHS